MKTIKLFTLFAVIFLAQMYLTSALTITSATNSPEQVQPGEKISLSLNIKNYLGTDLNDVTIKLNLNNPQNVIPFAPYQSSNEGKINSLNDGDSEKVNFDLIAFSNANSGTYSIPVTATYDNGTTIVNEDLGFVSIAINAKPEISVSVENSVLIKGQSGKLKIKLVNSGLGESKFLSVGINNANGIKIIGSNNVYIGNIDSNDFDNAEFNILTNANAPSTISLPITLDYMDFMNNKITENKIISVKTYTQKEAVSLGLVKGNNTFSIVIFIFSAIILYVVYRTIRKRRKNKRNGQ